MINVIALGVQHIHHSIHKFIVVVYHKHFLSHFNNPFLKSVIHLNCAAHQHICYSVVLA